MAINVKVANINNFALTAFSQQSRFMTDFYHYIKSQNTKHQISVDLIVAEEGILIHIKDNYDSYLTLHTEITGQIYNIPDGEETGNVVILGTALTDNKRPIDLKLKVTNHGNTIKLAEGEKFARYLHLINDIIYTEGGTPFVKSGFA
jgi:hypothetical protein